MSNVIQANDDSFESAVKSKGRAILKFGADWCRPCKTMAPIIKEVAAATDSVAVIEIDTEESPDVTSKFGVRGLPTLVLVEGDRELARHTGTMQKSQLMEWVKE